MNVKQFKLTWDADYGPMRRRGWSVAIDGAYVVQFERFLVVALWKAWRSVLVRDREPDDGEARGG